jgi:hypothetical protein
MSTLEVVLGRRLLCPNADALAMARLCLIGGAPGTKDVQLVILRHICAMVGSVFVFGAVGQRDECMVTCCFDLCMQFDSSSWILLSLADAPPKGIYDNAAHVDMFSNPYGWRVRGGSVERGGTLGDFRKAIEEGVKAVSAGKSSPSVSERKDQRIPIVLDSFLPFVESYGKDHACGLLQQLRRNTRE